MKRLWNFLRDERGLETVEYAIITGLIVAGTITAIIAIGGWVETQFTETQTTLEGTGAGT